MMKPLPSARVPWLVIFVLIAAIVLVYLGFLRSPDKLLGPPIPPNEYIKLAQPKPKPPVHVAPAPVVTPPAVPSAGQHPVAPSSAAVQPATPAAPPTMPPNSQPAVPLTNQPSASQQGHGQ